MKQVKYAMITKECVACGNCLNYCPVRAITIDSGICAIVDKGKCVGCGRCERVCPAGVITIVAKEEAYA